MYQTDIWHGLLEEVRAPRAHATFGLARERQPALRSYATLLEAVQAAARQRGTDEREAIVAAIVSEYRTSEGAATTWSAAALLAMAPVLASLARALKTRAERNDAKSIVLTAFLEAVNQIAPDRRVAFRLYCETRRRVLQAPRPSVEDQWRPSRQDVGHVATEESLGVEALVDGVRFARSASSVAPTMGETLVAYVERVQPSHSRRERLGRLRALNNKRVATLADLRVALRSFVIETRRNT
jgi:hypothetical protein